MTFYASDDKLATVGLADRVDDINRTAVRGRARRRGGGRRAGRRQPLPDVGLRPGRCRRRRPRPRAVRPRSSRISWTRGGPTSGSARRSPTSARRCSFVERAKATGLPVMVTMCVRTARTPLVRRRHARRLREELEDAGADIVGVQLPQRPEQQLPIAAEMGGRATAVPSPRSRSPTRPRRTPDFTAYDEFPYGLDPDDARAAAMLAASPPRAGGGRALRRFVLRRGRRARHARWRRRWASAPATSANGARRTGKAMSAYEYYEDERSS